MIYLFFFIIIIDSMKYNDQEQQENTKYLHVYKWYLFFLHYNCKSLGELEKFVEKLAAMSSSPSISRSSKLPLVFLKHDKNTAHTRVSKTR